MTGMLAALAFLITAAPESEARFTISSALTPSLIMPSAMLWNLVTSPPAFWMSDWMPAASNADLSSGRSAVSHRAEDAESGRMTPTLPPAAALVDDPAPPAALEAVDDVALLELPQAARPSRPAAPMAATPTKRMCMLRSFLGARSPDPRVHAPAVAGPAHTPPTAP